jgi:hypothetical protein
VKRRDDGADEAGGIDAEAGEDGEGDLGVERAEGVGRREHDELIKGLHEGREEAVDGGEGREPGGDERCEERGIAGNLDKGSAELLRRQDADVAEKNLQHCRRGTERANTVCELRKLRPRDDLCEGRRGRWERVWWGSSEKLGGKQAAGGGPAIAEEIHPSLKEKAQKQAPAHSKQGEGGQAGADVLCERLENSGKERDEERGVTRGQGRGEDDARGRRGDGALR